MSPSATRSYSSEVLAQAEATSQWDGCITVGLPNVMFPTGYNVNVTILQERMYEYACHEGNRGLEYSSQRCSTSSAARALTRRPPPEVRARAMRTLRSLQTCLKKGRTARSRARTAAATPPPSKNRDTVRCFLYAEKQNVAIQGVSEHGSA